MNLINRLPVLFLLLAFGGCDHGEEYTANEEMHDEASHAHGGGIVITHFTDHTELFVEFPPFVLGAESPFAAHFTTLSDYRAVAEGTLTVRLSGGGYPDETFTAGPSETPGIFTPVAIPQHAGPRQLRFELKTPDFTVQHDVGEVMVYSSPDDALEALPGEEEDGTISFLKETQWQVDFLVEPVTSRRLNASVPATGIIRGAADGEAWLSASATGQLRFNNEHPPRIGQQVTAGDLLGYVVPLATGEHDVASLRSDLSRAEAGYELAVSDRQRIAGLFEQGAVPRKRLESARTEEKIALATLTAARSRLQTLSGKGSQDATGVPLNAPIDGTIVGVHAATGQYVKPGDTLLHIVQTERLWLVAKVSEADSLKLSEPQGAWFATGESDAPFVIDRNNGRLIAASRVVDPETHTVDVVFEFDNPGELQIGMHINARVLTGQTVTAAAVPLRAIVDEQGQSVVYVMSGGESFDRRIIRTGIRDGNWIEIRSGLEPGERIVTRGAYLVRLAAAGPAEAGHGHAH